MEYQTQKSKTTFRLSTLLIGLILLLQNPGGQCFYKRGCHEKALELREEEANVVMSGTIRELYPDWQHPKMFKGEVEIKRVFKGDNEIRSMPGMAHARRLFRKMVTVDGFGDPRICDSKVRRHDTRIFLLKKKENGELKLESSVVRLTLPNIEQADAAVKGKFFFVLFYFY